MTAAEEGLAVGILVAVAEDWQTIGRLVAPAVVPAVAAAPFVGVPDCAACEAQHTKNN